MTIDAVKMVVSVFYGVTIQQLESKARGPQEVSFPRQVAMALCYELLEKSLKAVGKAFGGRDHGTVLHARRAVQDKIDTDAAFKSCYGELKLCCGYLTSSTSLDSSHL